MQDLNLSIEDLDIDLLVPPPARGKRAVPLRHTYTRDLNEADVLILIENPHRDVTTPSLLKIRTKHHQLARLLAEGVKQAEAALITGYSPTRISILKNDPAFCELIAYYSAMTEQVYLNVHERLAGVGTMALDELQERLEEHPELFTIEQLQDILAKTYDRAGYGPKSTIEVNKNEVTVANVLEAIKAEVRKKQDGNLTSLDARSRQSSSPRNSGFGLGLQIDGEASEHSSSTDSGSESGGPAVREAGGQKAIEPPRQEDGRGS